MIRKVLTLFAVFALLLSIFAFTGGNVHAKGSVHPTMSFATSKVADPMVVIAVDITPQSSCTNSITVNVGTPLQSTVDYSWEAGSIMRSELVSLHEALQQHKKYVLLPSTQASVKVWKQVTSQIENLMETELHIIKMSVKSNAEGTPRIACGYFGIGSQNWSAQGLNYYSEVHYKSDGSGSSCIKGYDYVISSYLEVTGGSQNIVLWWDHDQYDAANVGTGCPQAGPGFGKTISPNIVGLAGDYYENWLKDNACHYGYGNWYHNDVRLN